jgi:hypothetical protein
MNVFSPYHADDCFSKLLLKNQSWTFVDVKFEWFGDKVVPKVALHRNIQYVERWVQMIHRWIDWSWLPYNFAID